MDPNQRAAFLERCLERLLSWVSAADTKIATFFAINTAMFGVLAALSPRPCCWTMLAAVTASVATALLLGSLGMLAIAAFPRMGGPRQSLVYFGGISDRDFEQYWKDIQALSAQQYLHELARQCHRNAEIARLKYQWVSRSAVTLFLAVLPWLLAVFDLYRSLPGGTPK